MNIPQVTFKTRVGDNKILGGGCSIGGKWKDIKTNELFNNIFSVKKDSKYSYIYETIAYIFQNPKSDFKSNHSYRELILVSDLMQNTERLSFYRACNAGSENAICPSFEEFMNNLSDKDYLIATSPDGNNINLKMVYLKILHNI